MSHAAVPLALAVIAGRSRISVAVAMTGIALAILPDADVIGFKFDIAYADAWGHRGATHSLMMAIMVAALATMALRPARWMLVWLFLFISMVSHGLLDTLTSGGLGAALLWPFSQQRFFAPIQPIRVSPIGAGFFSERGLVVILSELRLIWLPAFLMGFIGWTIRKYRDRGLAKTE